MTRKYFLCKNFSICLKEKASFRKQSNKQKKSKDALEQKTWIWIKRIMLLPILTHTHPFLLYSVILMGILDLTDDFNECPHSQKCFIKNH
jgi:hypothetical protein